MLKIFDMLIKHFNTNIVFVTWHIVPNGDGDGTVLWGWGWGRTGWWWCGIGKIVRIRLGWRQNNLLCHAVDVNVEFITASGLVI